jgi:hypothetical protein
MEPLEQILRATISGFQSSLYRHMPLSVYRNFQLWALSSENPHAKTWMQIVGLPQFARLTQTLLGDSVSEEKWDALIQYSTYMNAYLIYETISDNLAFGLAAQRPDDTTYDLRREILIDFNKAMIARLKGNRVESDTLLAALQYHVAHLSGFEHSMTYREQQAIASMFLLQYPEYKADSVEFGTWNALVANVEACAEVVERMNGFRLGDFLRYGLIARYEGVNDLLYQNVNDLESLMKTSTYTILVMPVLTYYISVVTEALEPNAALEALLDSSPLYEALEDAALMVRLLNDIGTNLVATNQFHAPLLNELYTQISPASSAPPTLGDLLMNYGERSPLMTRIRKDVSFAEFNVSLHNLMTAPSNRMSLLLFGNNLVFFQEQYRQCQQRLKANLQTITQTLHSGTVSRLINDFVRFHEHIYQYQFDEQTGDYATKPDMQAYS